MKNERGQAIVLVAVALIVLLAITGLAIDGGRLYQARRQTQNGADAAALAGTRIIASQRCSPSGGLDSQVRTAVLDYAKHNGVASDGVDGRVWAWYVNKDSVQLAVVGTGSVPNGTTGVEVSTTITEPTTFMRILGRNQMAAAGAATAMFGPIMSGSGFLPIAFPVDRVDSITAENPPPRFTMFDGSGAICHQADVHCNPDPPAQSQRGWLNLDYVYNLELHFDSQRVVSTSASNARIKWWIDNGYPFNLYAGTRGAPPYNLDGDFIPGDPGARESSRSDVCSTHMGEVVFLPVFDYVYQRAQMQIAFPDDEPGNPLGFPNAHFYHIVGFMGARIDACGSGNNKTIRGEFVQAVITQGQINLDEGLQSGGGSNCRPYVVGVTLWK